MKPVLAVLVIVPVILIASAVIWLAEATNRIEA